MFAGSKSLYDPVKRYVFEPTTHRHTLGIQTIIPCIARHLLSEVPPKLLHSIEVQTMREEVDQLYTILFVPKIEPRSSGLMHRSIVASEIITTNLNFGDWTKIFGDERVTTALLDRLTCYGHILEFRGETFPFRQSLKQRTEEP